MKKFLLITVLLLPLIICSCDFFLPYDRSNEITVENRCGFRIEVYITQSPSKPPAFIPLYNGMYKTFTKLERGYYYLHVIKPDGSSHYCNRDPIKVEIDDSWIVTWNSREWKFDISCSM